MKRRRIAILTHVTFDPIDRGSGRFLAEIAPRLAQNFDIDLIARLGENEKNHLPKIISPTPHLTLTKLPYHYSRVAKNFLPHFGDETKTILENCDLVFIQDPVYIKPLLYLWRKIKKPWTMYVHSLDWELYPTAAQKSPWRKIAPLGAKMYCRFWYNRARHLFVPSQAAFHGLRDISVNTPISIIPHGVDAKKFSPPDDLASLRKKLGLPPEAVIIGYHGRMEPDRNISILIEAFKKLEEEYPNIFLLLVGNPPSIEDHPNIKWLPAQDPIAPWVQAMDIFCLLSTTETFSLATLEAMACGKAVLVHQLACFEEYLKDGQNGLFLKELDAALLKEKLEILIKNPSLRNDLGANAREKVLNSYSWEKTSQKLAEAFEKL